ncbi:MAG: CPBP family intramembrane metalloprotease [Oscillospiraceae bacterium]|nr:CPBP family intramembrane metalloprotease [Oscillospiraceae bacterium]
MQEVTAITQEYQRRSFQKAVFSISAVLFSGVLMLAVHFAESAYATDVLISLFGRSVLEVEWKVYLADIVLSLLLVLIPGAFLLIVFRKNPFSPFAGPPAAPKYPFLFLPMCIGALYALNFAVDLLFGKLLAPFDRPSYYPLTLAGMVLYFVRLVVMPALFEEWLFRGIMLKQMIPSVGKWPAVFVSAFVFGLMHLDPAQSVFAFGFGLFAGYAYISTGSVWFGVLLHMVNNALTGCFNYWTRVFGWESPIFDSYIIFMILFGIVSLSFYRNRVRETGVRTRRTREERLLPDGKTVFRATLHSPMLYLLAAAYVFLLWLYYFAG